MNEMTLLSYEISGEPIDKFLSELYAAEKKNIMDQFGLTEEEFDSVRRKGFLKEEICQGKYLDSISTPC